MSDDFKALQAEVSRAKEEVTQLKQGYEQVVKALREDISYFKEQLTAQRDMLQMTIDHANNMEKELKVIKKRVKMGDFKTPKS